MSRLGRLWARLATVTTTTALSLVVPAAAWAAGSPGLAAVDRVRRRAPRIGRGLGLGGFCCLVVVVVIVVVIYLIIRASRRRRNHTR